MSFNRMVVVALLVVAGIGGALACGPNFPWQLLNNRDQTVSDRVELNFAFEATHLVDVPGDGPRAVERDDTNSPEAVASEREEVRSGAWRGLLAGAIDTDRLEAKLDAARAANDGDAALSARPSRRGRHLYRRRHRISRRPSRRGNGLLRGD